MAKNDSLRIKVLKTDNLDENSTDTLKETSGDYSLKEKSGGSRRIGLSNRRQEMMINQEESGTDDSPQN